MPDNYKSPVYAVRAVPVEKVVANSYNPNIVAPPEMRLLELSIWEDGYTMPCVCYYLKDKDLYEIVDGYHRYMVMKTSRRIYERENGLLPVAVRQRHIQQDSLHHTAQQSQRNPLHRTDDGNRQRIGTLRHVRQMDYEQHRHG